VSALCTGCGENAAVEDQICAACLEALLSESARDEVYEAAREARSRANGTQSCAFCERAAINIAPPFIALCCAWHDVEAEELEQELFGLGVKWDRRERERLAALKAKRAAAAAADQQTNDTEAA